MPLSRAAAAETLGVSKDDTDSAIRAAYRRSAIVCHPPGPAAGEWPIALRQRWRTLGMAYRRLCPECREIETDSDSDSDDYGNGEVFDIFHAVLRGELDDLRGRDGAAAAKLQDAIVNKDWAGVCRQLDGDASGVVNTRGGVHPDGTAATRAAHENYDSPSSSDDDDRPESGKAERESDAGLPPCRPERERAGDVGRAAAAGDGAERGVAGGKQPRLPHISKRGTKAFLEMMGGWNGLPPHQNYDSMSSSEEEEEDFEDFWENMSAEDIDIALEQLQEQKESLNDEYHKRLQEAGSGASRLATEERQAMLAELKRQKMQFQVKKTLLLRKRDKLEQQNGAHGGGGKGRASQGARQRADEAMREAQQRADDAMRELLQEEERAQEKARSKQKGRKVAAQEQADAAERASAGGAGLTADADGAQDRNDCGEAGAAGGGEEGVVGGGEGVGGAGRKLTKAERKKVQEEKRAEALRQKKAEKRFLQRQRRKEERDEERRGGGRADSGDEIDLTSAFALAKSKGAASERAGAGAGEAAARFRAMSGNHIVMHADAAQPDSARPQRQQPGVPATATHEPKAAHEPGVAGPNVSGRKALASQQQQAPPQQHPQQAAPTSRTPAGRGFSAGSGGGGGGSGSGRVPDAAGSTGLEDDAASKLREMGFSDADIERAAHAAWREPTLDALLEFLISEAGSSPGGAAGGEGTEAAAPAPEAAQVAGGEAPTLEARSMEPGDAPQRAASGCDQPPHQTAEKRPAPEGVRLESAGAAPPGLSVEHILEQIEMRRAARDARDFATADSIRDALLASGVEIKDKGKRTVFTRIQSSSVGLHCVKSHRWSVVHLATRNMRA